MSPNETIELQILTRVNFGLIVLFVAVYVWREVRQPNSKGNFMSDFGKKLLALGVVSLVMFGVFAGITYVKVHSYDVGEVTMNAMQALVAGLTILVANAARSVFIVLLAASLLSTSVADAGLLSNLLGRIQRPSSSCPGGNCGLHAVKPMPLPAKPLPSATKPVKPMAPKPGPVLVK